MERLNEIKINQFQLALLLDEEQKDTFNYFVNNGVICMQCDGIAVKGINIEETFLTKLNDILVRGTCNLCNGKVARVLEYGVIKEFYEKAMKFRKDIS